MRVSTAFRLGDFFCEHFLQLSLGECSANLTLCAFFRLLCPFNIGRRFGVCLLGAGVLHITAFLFWSDIDLEI